MTEDEYRYYVLGRNIGFVLGVVASTLCFALCAWWFT